MMSFIWDFSSAEQGAKYMTSLWINLFSLHENYTPEHTYICMYSIAHVPRHKSNLLNSEDFGLANARRILDKYRSSIPCFNDDIQGTGCVTLAAIIAGSQVSRLKLTDMRTVIFGSGTAGTGIAEMVRDAISADTEMSKHDAAKQIWWAIDNYLASIS